MVNAINHIGHVMRIKTVAEFVENQAVLKKLIQTGVDYAQGYHIHTPCPLDEIYDVFVVAHNKNKT